MTGLAKAGAGSALGGETIGLVAAGIFLVFAIWIVVQRLRAGRSMRSNGGDRRGD